MGDPEVADDDNEQQQLNWTEVFSTIFAKDAPSVPLLIMYAHQQQQQQLSIGTWGDPRYASPRFLATAAFAKRCTNGQLRDDAMQDCAAAMRITSGEPLECAPRENQHELIQGEAAKLRDNANGWLFAYSLKFTDQDQEQDQGFPQETDKVLWSGAVAQFPALELVCALLSRPVGRTPLLLDMMTEAVRTYVNRVLERYPL